MATAIQYLVPDHWIKYDPLEITTELTEAKASVMSLRAIPFQRRWVDELQKIQLKMEVAGTSQIEGADFAGNELEVAMKAETPDELITRSQRQAAAATKTYRWIATLPEDQPMSASMICQVHKMIVTDCDEDHCAPGIIRNLGQNVTFGSPLHRGVSGGDDCEVIFNQLVNEMRTTFMHHDPLIRALALHYHFASMHPFSDGNGRTARALEALMLQRAGLKDSLFIAMSNYYHDEKRAYLESLATVRTDNHNLTAFLKFGLKGIAIQSTRLSGMIRREVSKQLFRNLMFDLFSRLESTRKRVIVKRQLALLQRLLDTDDPIDYLLLAALLRNEYGSKKEPMYAVARDLNKLHALGAIKIDPIVEKEVKKVRFMISVNLDWPMKITETEFFSQIEKLPKSKTTGFLSALNS
jgi:Fic family protein